MNKSLFRQSSIDRVNSPEQLNEYIRVAKPSVWIVLAAVIILLCGVLIWAIFGTVTTELKTGVSVSDGIAVCYINEKDVATLSDGLAVTVGDVSGTIKKISDVPLPIADDQFLQYYCGIEPGGFCYEVELSVSGLDDGVYPAVIISGSVRPIYFVIH